MKLFKLAATIVAALAAGAAWGAPWTTVQPARPSPVHGSPIRVEEVITTREIFRDDPYSPDGGAYYYTYKLIVRRPSGDNGWGIAGLGGLRFRLYYWASTVGTNPYVALHSDMDVYQDIQPTNPRQIVVHLLQGLRPGRYRISVAPIPYPMIGDYSLKDLIRYYPDELIQFYDIVSTALSATSFWGGIKAIISSQAGDYAKDALLEEIMEQIAYHYGEVGELEVLAKMPDIAGQPEAVAARMLSTRSLLPRPGPPVATGDAAQDGRIALHRFSPGVRLAAGTGVPYKVFRFVPGAETQGYTGPGGLFGTPPPLQPEGGLAPPVAAPPRAFTPGSPPPGYSQCGCFSSDGRNPTCRNNGCVEPPNYLMTCYWECRDAAGNLVKIRGRDGVIMK